MCNRLVDTYPKRRLARLVLRLPIRLYRAGLGWLLDDRFLMLTHTGRKSGRSHQVILEVIRHDKATDTYIIASGWGEKSDWFRNILQTPDVMIQTGHRQIEVKAVRLSVEEAGCELRDYARRHPIAFGLIGRMVLGQHLTGKDEEFSRLAQLFPFIALLPRGMSKND